jgi:hypothetical protein
MGAVSPLKEREQSRFRASASLVMEDQAPRPAILEREDFGAHEAGVPRLETISSRRAQAFGVGDGGALIGIESNRYVLEVAHGNHEESRQAAADGQRGAFPY